MLPQREKMLCLDLINSLQAFILMVQKLSENESLLNNIDFISQSVEKCKKLYQCATALNQSSDHDVKEIGSLITNIFQQQLKTEETQGQSMIETIEQKDPDQATNRFVSILKEYLKHPETTKSFVRELEILNHNVEEILEQAS